MTFGQESTATERSLSNIFSLPRGMIAITFGTDYKSLVFCFGWTADRGLLTTSSSANNIHKTIRCLASGQSRSIP